MSWKYSPAQYCRAGIDGMNGWIARQFNQPCQEGQGCSTANQNLVFGI